MPICTHKRYDWLATAVSKSPENKAKNPLSGQTCGQVRKMGLFNPESREEQALYIYQEDARKGIVADKHNNFRVWRSRSILELEVSTTPTRVKT